MMECLFCVGTASQKDLTFFNINPLICDVRCSNMMLLSASFVSAFSNHKFATRVDLGLVWGFLGSVLGFFRVD